MKTIITEILINVRDIQQFNPDYLLTNDQAMVIKAEELLKKIGKINAKPVTLLIVIDAVMTVTNTTLEEIISLRRKGYMVRARGFISYFSRGVYKLDTPARVAEMIGRSRCDVIHHKDRFTSLVEVDKEYKEIAGKIQMMINRKVGIC